MQASLQKLSHISIRLHLVVTCKHNPSVHCIPCALSCTHTRTPAVQVKIRDLKSQISSQSKKNFTLDKDLRFLDSKIALLINHKISIEVGVWVAIVVHGVGSVDALCDAQSTCCCDIVVYFCRVSFLVFMLVLS